MRRHYNFRFFIAFLNSQCVCLSCITIKEFCLYRCHRLLAMLTYMDRSISRSQSPRCWCHVMLITWHSLLVPIGQYELLSLSTLVQLTVEDLLLQCWLQLAFHTSRISVKVSLLVWWLNGQFQNLHYCHVVCLGLYMTRSRRNSLLILNRTITHRPMQASIIIIIK